MSIHDPILPEHSPQPIPVWFEHAGYTIRHEHKYPDGVHDGVRYGSGRALSLWIIIDQLGPQPVNLQWFLDDYQDRASIGIAWERAEEIIRQAIDGGVWIERCREALAQRVAAESLARRSI